MSPIAATPIPISCLMEIVSLYRSILTTIRTQASDMFTTSVAALIFHPARINAFPCYYSVQHQPQRNRQRSCISHRKHCQLHKYQTLKTNITTSLIIPNVLFTIFSFPLLKKPYSINVIIMLFCT